MQNETSNQAKLQENLKLVKENKLSFAILFSEMLESYLIDHEEMTADKLDKSRVLAMTIRGIILNS